MDSVFRFFQNLFNYHQEQGGWWVLAVLDILVLTGFIYFLIKFLIKTHADKLITGILLLGGIYIASVVFNLSTVLWLLKQFSFVIVIVIVIVFQPEIRKIFSRIARTGFLKKAREERNFDVKAVLDGAELCRSQKRGALILFERKVALKDLMDSGTRLDAEISVGLLGSIFLFDTPLHDGAVIIQNGRIAAAGCFLPLSEQADIKKSFGTRHRAGLGASENSDAVVLIVSEETGALSLAYESNLYYDLSRREIENTLAELLDEQVTDELTLSQRRDDFEG